MSNEPNTSTDITADEGPSRGELYERCSELAQDPYILGRVDAEARKAGFAGPTDTLNLIYLAATTRLLEQPVSVAVHGPSSGGKSFTIAQSLKFLPPAAYKELTAMSERALQYSKESLRHRMLVIHEGAGIAEGHQAYIVRSLLSERRINYEYTDFKNKKTVRVVREGPTGLITSTARSIDRELGTRLLMPNVADTDELSSAILRAQAEQAMGIEKAQPDYGPFQDLQSLLALGPCKVHIPFAGKLADEITPAAVRVRRDFPSVLGLVMAHALLQRESRDHDHHLGVVASPQDYDVVYGLVSGIVAEAAQATVAPSLRETVEAVRSMYYKPAHNWEPVTINRLAEELGLDRSSTSRRASGCITQGYLYDQGPGGRGKPKLLVPGDPIPEDTGVLPPPEVAT